MQYREPYPTWVVMGMDVLAAGILIASFRDAWAVVSSLGEHAETGDWTNSLVAGAVVLAIDASILLLEQARSHIKLRGGNTRWNDIWVTVLICISAMLNVRYLAATGEMLDRVIGGILGVAIPSTIAVLGYLKGDMLAYNARHRQQLIEESQGRKRDRDPDEFVPFDADPASPSLAMTSEEPTAPLFRLKR